MTTTQATAADPTAAALERARALARAIGESAAFRAFEAAQEAFAADADLGFRLSAFQVREQELRLSRSWGGADPEEVRAMEREWEDLAKHPVLAAHVAAREELLRLLREVAGAIGEGVGLDYGAACASAGGCC
jgi:cell fate (sporulation/competence/biofilm development) regulator YlbF (YheA/YmcA/DUF963 family)